MDKKEYNKLLEKLSKDLILQLKFNKGFLDLLEKHIKKEVKRQIKKKSS